MRYTHIFWDFDGTLYDTYPVMAGVLREALAARGIRESAADIERMMRVSMGHARDHYREKYALNDGFFAGLREATLGVMDQRARPFRGIPALLREALERGGRHYLYTHRGRSALVMLERDGLLGLFADWVTGEDDFPRKPDPTALRHLLGKHGLPPGECLMVGDRQIDILAGESAGMEGYLFCEDVGALRGALGL